MKPSPERRRLPDRRKSLRYAIPCCSGHKLHITAGLYEDGRLGEIFLDFQREGSFGRSITNAFAISVSLGLQHGIPLEAYTHAFRDFRMDPDIIRAIFDTLEEEHGIQTDQASR